MLYTVMTSPPAFRNSSSVDGLCSSRVVVSKSYVTGLCDAPVSIFSSLEYKSDADMTYARWRCKQSTITKYLTILRLLFRKILQRYGWRTWKVLVSADSAIYMLLVQGTCVFGQIAVPFWRQLGTVIWCDDRRWNVISDCRLPKFARESFSWASCVEWFPLRWPFGPWRADLARLDQRVPQSTPRSIGHQSKSSRWIQPICRMTS